MEMTIEQAAQLRKLRLWHWLEVARLRKEQREAEAGELRNRGSNNRYADLLYFEGRKARAQCAIHLGAVQVLNDFFPMGETAEKDEAAGMRP